ncbi:MAG: DMT family transporter [bacterium]
MPPITLPPALLALIASALFGAGLILVRMGLRFITPPAGAVVNISTTAILFWCLSPFLMDWSGFNTRAVWVFAAVGFFHPVMSTTMAFEAVRRMGATVSGIITSAAPLFATVAAMVLLGERLSAAVALGTLTIVSGVAVLSWTTRGKPRHWALIVIALPLGAAMVRGFTQAGTKFGLAIFPDPLLAGLVSYSISFFSVRVASRLLSGGKRPDYNLRGIAWFIVVGMFNGSALFISYMALNTGKVVVVAPIVATFPLFTVLFTLLFFPGERITARIIAGALLVVGGVALISR